MRRAERKNRITRTTQINRNQFIEKGCKRFEFIVSLVQKLPLMCMNESYYLIIAFIKAILAHRAHICRFIIHHHMVQKNHDKKNYQTDNQASLPMHTHIPFLCYWIGVIQ